MNSSLASEVRPGADGDLLHRHFARALAADDHGDGAGGDQRRHAVGRRRGVAQIAGQRGAALDLGRADQVERLDHAGPGRAQAGMLASTSRAGRGGADDEAAGFLADADDAGDALGIDDQFGLGAAGRAAAPAGRSRRTRTLARPEAPANSLTASSTVEGAA